VIDMAPDGASGAGSVIATSFGLPPLGAVPAGRRPGGAERVDGLGELQDLGGQGQQLLVLLLFFLDVCHWWSARTWRFSSARFWLIITKVDRKMASSDTIMVNSPNG
jgi:hypothetical protein